MVSAWFKLILCAGALLISSACVHALGWSAAGHSFGRSQEALEFSTEANSGGYSDTGPYKCTYEEGAIHYNGNTTMQLVNCLMEAPEDARLLVITSAGGDVDVAIFAAHLVSGMKLDVEVVGRCASSCANYILPAAKRIRVDPFSIVLVHGGPLPPNRESLIEAMAKAGFTSERPNFEKAVEDNLVRSALTHRLHENFVRNYSVNSGYYHFDDIRQAVAEQELSYPGFFLDPYWLKACLPGVEVIADEPERESLVELFPKHQLVSFSDIRGQKGECRD